tara:strand:+ start:180 stop:731 length:552 start_codon:yes stop_codon:yes gene_type:complete
MAQGIGIAQAIGMAVSVGSAVMKLQEGQAQAAQMNAMAANLEAQSQFTRFKAKQDSLKYKKQANDELNKILIRMAQINAAAGAGHMSPFSGNAFGLKIRALSVGGQNFATAKGNEDIVRLMGYAQANLQLSQAGQAREAANAAYKKGVFGAVGALGMGAYSYWKTDIPGGGASANYGKGFWGT